MRCPVIFFDLKRDAIMSDILVESVFAGLVLEVCLLMKMTRV